MAYKVISKVNARLKLFHRKNKYVTPNLCCLIRNALIQPHFDYACWTWYPNLSKKQTNKQTKYRTQTSENKSIRLCLQLDKISHIFQKEFDTFNWFHFKERYNQWLNSIAFKYFRDHCLHYLNDAFIKAPE